MPLVSSYKIKMLLLSMEGHLVMESLPPPMHADNISSNMGNMFFQIFISPSPRTFGRLRPALDVFFVLRKILASIA